MGKKWESTLSAILLLFWINRRFHAQIQCFFLDIIDISSLSYAAH